MRICPQDLCFFKFDSLTVENYGNRELLRHKHIIAFPSVSCPPIRIFIFQSAQKRVNGDAHVSPISSPNLLIITKQDGSIDAASKETRRLLSVLSRRQAIGYFLYLLICVTWSRSSIGSIGLIQINCIIGSLQQTLSNDRGPMFVFLIQIQL